MAHVRTDFHIENTLAEEFAVLAEEVWSGRHQSLEATSFMTKLPSPFTDRNQVDMNEYIRLNLAQSHTDN